MQMGLAGLGLLAAGPALGATPPDYVLHNHKPIDLETLPHRLKPFVTPTQAFYIRSHHPHEPVVELDSWRLKIDGLVNQAAELRWADVEGMTPCSLTAVLQCSGNGRAFFRPRVPGSAWKEGALGNAQWTGIPLRDVVQKLGVDPRARFLVMNGSDQPLPKTATPKFQQVLPLDKALDPDTLLAFQMNGKPLSHLHGFPLRVIAPGWQGQKWVKWLSHLEFTEHDPNTYWYAKAYRVPATPQPPGRELPPEQMVPIEEIPVKSLLLGPVHGARLPLGRPVMLEGKAWTGGKKRVARVEVDTGSGWETADLGEVQPYTWVEFRHSWTPRARGKVELRCRATDDSGATQPEKPGWNPSGYNWNGIDHKGVTVV